MRTGAMLVVACALIACSRTSRPRSEALVAPETADGGVVPCPYPPWTRAERPIRPEHGQGLLFDQGWPFERGASVGGRAVVCRQAGALTLAAGQLLRLETTDGDFVVVGTVAAGSHPIFTVESADFTSPLVLVQLAPERPRRWEYLPRDGDLDVRTHFTAFVGETHGRAQPGSRWPTLDAVARRGVALLDDGKLLVHPSFGAARGFDGAGRLVAVAVGEFVPIELFMPVRATPVPRPVAGGSCGDVQVRPVEVACPRALAPSRRCVSLGELHVTTGRVAAADPLVQLGMPPFTPEFPIGRHPITLALRDGRVARALVQVRDAQVARWEPARLDGEPVGAARGYAVDSGTGAFFDVNAADRLLLRNWKQLERRSHGDDPLLAELRAAGLDSAKAASVCGDAVTGANLVVFHSGEGDGVYVSYVGSDENGRPVALLTDFAIDDGGAPRVP